MTPFHAAVWIDHKVAKIFHIEEKRFDESLIHAPHNQVHRDTGAAEQYYHKVSEALSKAGEIIVLGPGSAKLELVKHVHKHHHLLVDKIIGVETVDHPTDKQIVAFVRKYFLEEDRMHGLVT